MEGVTNSPEVEATTNRALQSGVTKMPLKKKIKKVLKRKVKK